MAPLDELTSADYAEFAGRYRSILESVTSVRAIAGGSAAGKRRNQNTLFIENDPRAIAELVVALRIQPLGARAALMTPGDPTLVLSDPSGVVMTVQCLGDDFVRADVLPEDARLSTSGALSDWINGRV